MESSDVLALLDLFGRVRIAVGSAAADGRRVDLHPAAFRPHGSGVQAGLDGRAGFEYPADGFATGSADGREVPCLPMAQQLRFREGYPPRDVDLHDVALLKGIRVEPRS